MLTVGLTGNMGSGKSTVLGLLDGRPDVCVFEMDFVAKSILFSPEFEDAAHIILGDGAFVDGALDSGRVADIIFSDGERRQLLEESLHPLVIEAVLHVMAKAHRDGRRIFVAESALLFEKGLQHLFDVTVAVTCPTDERRRRLKEGRGFTDEQIDARLATQMSEEEKIGLADLAVDNSGHHDSLSGRVNHLMRLLNARADSVWWTDTAVRMLKWRYTEPPRAYHNWRHVEHCLREFEQIRHQARNPAAVEWAIRFHDAIYVPGADDNEEKSADLARLWLDDEIAEEAARLIMLTKTHDPADDDIDGQIICDCDLAVLAFTPDMFDQYEVLIREEYSFVSDDDFRLGRMAFIRSMLDRDRIFRTGFFYEKYEMRARENLKRSLKRLE